MKTIKIDLEDNIYNEILKKGIDIQMELKKYIDKILYYKEYQMAKELQNSINDVKNNKTKDLNELLNEI